MIIFSGNVDRSITVTQLGGNWMTLINLFSEKLQIV